MRKGFARDRGDVYLPTKEIVSNPLRKGELRNCPCLCGSGKKIKKCCGKAMAVPRQFAEALNRLALDQASLLESELAAHSSKGDDDGHTDERSSTR